MSICPSVVSELRSFRALSLPAVAAACSPSRQGRSSPWPAFLSRLAKLCPTRPESPWRKPGPSTRATPSVLRGATDPRLMLRAVQGMSETVPLPRLRARQTQRVTVARVQGDETTKSPESTRLPSPVSEGKAPRRHILILRGEVDAQGQT